MIGSAAASWDVGSTSILTVWQETLSKVDKLDVHGGRWYPEDLSGPGTGLDVERATAAQQSVGHQIQGPLVGMVPSASASSSAEPQCSNTIAAAGAAGPTARPYMEVLKEAGVLDNVLCTLRTEEMLYPPLVLNETTKRLHWGSRENLPGEICGTLSGLTSFRVCFSPSEFFQSKAIWCCDCQKKHSLPTDWQSNNIIMASPPASDSSARDSDRSDGSDDQESLDCNSDNIDVSVLDSKNGASFIRCHALHEQID